MPIVSQQQISSKLSESGESKLNNLDQNVKIVVWALLIMMAGMVFALGAVFNDYLAAKQATYQNLVDKVNEQNYKIDRLNKTVDLVCKTWRKDCPIY